jgi:predicted signal transduction protein with EAL and GGDEF domain
MVDSPNDLVIVRSTIDLARNLGLAVVAEGIESERHLIALQDLGCDLGQGFFVSHPLPVERLTSWFGEAPWRLPSRAGRSAPQMASHGRRAAGGGSRAPAQRDLADAS